MGEGDGRVEEGGWEGVENGRVCFEDTYDVLQDYYKRGVDGFEESEDGQDTFKARWMWLMLWIPSRVAFGFGVFSYL